ncbi:MAG: hypothetical protein ACTSQS_00240 [Promethearchaeota archaeon]
MITNPKDLKKLLKQNALIVKNIIKLAQKENLIPDNDRQNVISEVQDLLMEFDNLLSRFTKNEKDIKPYLKTCENKADIIINLLKNFKNKKAEKLIKELNQLLVDVRNFIRRGFL